MVFLTATTLLQHTNDQHPDQDGTKIPLGGDPEQEYVCAVCNDRGSSRDVKNHLILTHFTSFACPFFGCGHAYDALRRLIQHMNEKHINNYKCKYCKEESATFETEEDLKQHHENDCKAPRQECDHCGEKLNDRFFSNFFCKISETIFITKKFLSKIRYLPGIFRNQLGFQEF
jgi:DNA-directed RNA polymerase subunit RPC12/RpoP